MRVWQLGSGLRDLVTGRQLGFVACLCLPLMMNGCNNGALELSAATLEVVSFTLIDADTDKPIAAFDPIAPETTLNLAALPSQRFNLRANTRPARVGSVRFTLDRTHRHVENIPPYALASHTEGDYHIWTLPTGRHDVSATPYPQVGAKGKPGTPLALSFNVVRQASDVAASGPTLLASYSVLHEHGPRYEGITYRPRQFKAAPYEGWDVLTLPGDTYRTYTYPDWLSLTLNRDATLVVLWDGSQPGGWLESWQELAPVGGKRAFKKVFAAGEIALGAIEGTENQPYTVLFAEADGRPSAAPSVPAGMEEPEPNTRCPVWVHDQYVAEGSGGHLYPSWHPQIDPQYWCYVGHSHGSSGDLLFPGFKPVFNHAEAHGGPPEAHEGFNGLVVNYTSTEGRPYRLYKETHAETNLQRRACTEHHSHRMVLYDVIAKNVVLDIHWKPSFGPSRNANTIEPYAPSDCPENASLPSSLGARNIPHITDGGYESWQFVGDTYPQLGIYGKLTVAYLNPYTKCADSQCNTVVSTGRTNTRIWMITPGSDVDEGWGVDASLAFAEGEFYTDIYGEKRLHADDPGAVRQYVAPNFKVKFVYEPRFFSQDAWLNAYIDTSVKPRDQPDLELEDGLDEVE